MAKSSITSNFRGVRHRASLVARRFAAHGQAPQHGRAASREHQTAHVRRRECRSVFFARRTAADLSDQSGRAGHVRSDLHDERRRIEQEAAEQGRADDVRIFFSGRQIDRVRVDASGSAECPPRPSYARGYVWPVYDALRHLPRGARWIESAPPHEHAGLRRGSHHRPRRPHRVYERARRRHGNLFDERRRLRRTASDESSRPGRRSVVFA